MNATMKNSISFVLLFFVLAIVACVKEEDTLETEYLNVDGQLVPYFELFVDEAAKRGILVNFGEKPVEGYIAVILEDGVAGQCSTNDQQDLRRLTIDRQFWINLSDLEREFLIFHELGHCYLDRGHLDTRNANGTCVSMMQSGLGNCRMNYTLNNRDAYINELFSGP